MSEDRRRRFEALFAAHGAAVRDYSRRRTDHASADDVLSEVFVVVWRRLDDVPPDALPWLLACARRVLANQRRGATRRNALTQRLRQRATQDMPPLGMADGGLARALAELGERDREALMLVAWEGLEPARAAAALECSRGALAVRLHRARRRLAAALERADGDGAPCSTREAMS